MNNENNGKARLIVLDIETYRTRDAELVEQISQEAIDKRPAQNALKELKLEWDTETAREARAAEALAKTAVDPLLAEVLCCAVAVGADGGRLEFEGMTESNDRPMLAQLAEDLNQMAGPRTIWVGHNIEGFDLPVLLNRWRHYDIRPPEHFPMPVRHGWRGWVYDTMLRCPSKNGMGFVSLDDACAAYGIAGESIFWRGEPMDGSRVGEAFKAGKYDMIMRYCDQDVQTTRALYLRMTAGDTWGTYGLADEVAQQIAAIEASGQSEGVRAIAKCAVLERAGLVPK